MDLGMFAKVVFTTIGGTAALLLMIGFLAKKWIGTRIVESIKTVYAKQLEWMKHDNAKDLADFKAKLELQNAREQEQISADKTMFQRFLETLPSSGSIAFIDVNNFAGSFDWHYLDQLRTFDHEWSDAEHEFLDTQMEAKRKELKTLVEGYLGFLGTNTWRLKDQSSWGFASVPQEWEEEQPERFHEVVNSLHKQGEKIVSVHRELVRLGRQHLKC
jgi:hypothetical protein